MDLSLLTRKSDVEWWIEPRGRHARAGRHLRERSARAGHGRQGVRAGHERRHAAGHRTGVLRHAGRALGLRVSRSAASRPSIADRRRRRVGRRRRLRHLLRRAHCCHRTDASTDSSRSRSGSPTSLSRSVPAGVGSAGRLRLDAAEMDAMLTGGARWAVERGYGTAADLERSRSTAACRARSPTRCREQAKNRQRDEMGTLGSGNHYLEVQQVARSSIAAVAAAFGLREGDVVVSIHCGSRGLGHQIGTEFLKRDGARRGQRTASSCPTASWPARRSTRRVGQAYLGAMRAAINCALANRQIITHLVRQAFAAILPAAEPDAALRRVAQHLQSGDRIVIDGQTKRAVRASQGRHAGASVPAIRTCRRRSRRSASRSSSAARWARRPTCWWARSEGVTRSFGSSCHGAGRSMSRHAAAKQWRGRR